VSRPLRDALRPLARAARHSLAAADGLVSYAAGLPTSGSIRVSYGFPVPPATEVTHGGVIKLQSLATRFPHEPRRFNILYLVSSRLPDAAPLLARLARAKGGKVVVNQNGVAYPAWLPSGWRQINDAMAQVLRQADHVVYQSAFCKTAADRFLGAAACAHEIVYNPVDTDRFRPAQRPGSARFTLLLAGTQHAEYRVDTAIRVLALVARRIPSVRLIITGRLRWTSESAALRAMGDLARSLGVDDRTEWIGPYTPNDAPAIYQRADVLLHTKYKDPCPTVVLEAMSSGLPVVYSASGGVPELVGDHAGVGVPVADSWDHEEPPDPGQMAAAVIEAADRRHELSAAARQRAADRFDARQWLDRHETVFSELCRPAHR
jgi:glycosyltransferase involved in cell wall biosynthesis